MSGASASAQLARSGRLNIQEKPYAVVCLGPLPNGDRRQLFLPLTFAYILSSVIRFVLPIGSDDATATTEAVFDELLKGLSLDSKGIVYARSCSPQDFEMLLHESTLVLTTVPEVERAAAERQTPAALITEAENGGPVVRLSNLEKLGDAAVKAQLTACARLVNVQSGGYVIGGHFLMSW